MRRNALLIALTLLLSLLTANAAQAIVVNDQGTSAGVALAPGAKLPKAVTAVSASGACSDPWLSHDLGGPSLPSAGLCYQGGAVMHRNESFAITWDPLRRYWQTTRNYIEQYLRDVADGSGTFSSPFALTGQYADLGGRAANASLYGGGCIDYGSVGGSACQFTNAVTTGPGRAYPASGCPQGGGQACLTDAQLQDELSKMVTDMGLTGHVQPGYTPLLVLLTPSGVQTCLDASGTLCSASGVSSAGFCSYHSQVNVGGTEFAYVVQPWTANTACDDPNIQPLGSDATAEDVAKDAGSRLVSPLSQGQLAAIVNPALNGWFGLGGSEINDNDGCAPVPPTGHDQVTVGKSSQNPYYVQPEFSNAGLLESDPNAPTCALGVVLAARFVVPSPINNGDVVAFDGSVTVSSLIVPYQGYAWNFGDGTTATGPSVVHTYSAGGTYTVQLTATDRGGNVSTLSQQVTVSGPPAPKPAPELEARIQLLPQSLGSMLRSGIALRLTSNETVDGITTLSIPRDAARRAHLHTGRSANVVIGRGTVSGLKKGTMELHLKLPRSTAAKLKRLAHVTVTVQLSLVASGHLKLSIVAAGRY